MDFFLFIVSIGLLWLGGHFIVDGASGIARKLHVSELIIGLTLVSIGTSLPEVVVNIIASVKQESDIVIGNIIGSNISNTAFILGLIALLSPLTIPTNRLRRECLCYVVCIGLLFGGIVFSNYYTLHLWQGIILISSFVGSVYMFFRSPQPDASDNTMESSRSFILYSMFVSGCVLLPLGGYVLVESAIRLATQLGVSKSFISLFAVALGTSLPEMATSLIAAKRGNTSMALGNIIGSNIFNITLVLGLSVLVSPLLFNPLFFLDLGVMIGVMFPVIYILLATQYTYFSRRASLVLLLSYCLYIGFIYMR